MKRARELDELVVEIVRESKAKDEEGNPLYPVIHEPMVLAFFGAPEALSEVLRESPILVLNLLQANKALMTFWNRFEGVWIAWTDMLIEKEMGAYVGEIYPFLVVQEHRANLLRGVEGAVVADFISNEREADSVTQTLLHPIFLSHINTMTGRSSVNHVHYVVYHDPFTQLVIELSHKLDEFPFRFEIGGHRLIRVYANAKIGSLPYFTLYPDCFLVSQKRGVPLKFDNYNTNAVRVRLVEFREKLRKHPTTDIKLFAETEALLDKLTTLIDEGVMPEKPVPLLLDKNTAAPYRILLYDKDQGLLKTPQQQRAFFVSVLYHLAGHEEEEARLIEKYGCSLCQRETELVDPLSMRAFCSEACLNT